MVRSVLKHFMVLDDMKATQLKRGGGVRPADERAAAGSRRATALGPASSPLFLSNEFLQFFNEQILPSQPERQVGTRPNY